MKTLNFVSSVNGLQVVAPADAFPSPHCDAVMCPERLDSAPVGFACTPQLDPGAEGPVMFSVLTGNNGSGRAFATYSVPAWAVGSAPNGQPLGLVDFALWSNDDALYVYYDGGLPYGGISVTLYNSEGNIVIADLALAFTGAWEINYQTPGFPVLAIGETYCVELTFTPFEEE